MVKHPCISCKKAVTGKSVQCCVCDRWNHASSECDMPDDTFKLIQSMKDRTGTHCWMCDGCSLGYKKLSDALAANAKEISGLKASVETLTTGVSENKNAIDQTNKHVDKELSALNEKVDKVNKQALVQESSDSVLDEFEEREARKHNIVIHNLPEPPESMVSGVQRKNYDSDTLDNLFKDMKVKLSVKTNVKFSARVGAKNPTKPRPLLVGFHKEEKNEIFAAANNLKHSKFFNKISIIPDLTPCQRQREKTLIEKAEKFNSEMSAEQSLNWIWKVVGMRGKKRLIKTRLRRVEISSPNMTLVGEPEKRTRPRLDSKRTREEDPEELEELETSQRRKKY